MNGKIAESRDHCGPVLALYNSLTPSEVCTTNRMAIFVGSCYRDYGESQSILALILVLTLQVLLYLHGRILPLGRRTRV